MVAETTEDTGWLFPRTGAFATAQPDGSIEVTDVYGGSLFRADGKFAEQLRSFLTDGSEPSSVAALGAGHPLSRFVESTRHERPVPLEPAAVVALGGFGMLFVELLGRCNERCLHCYASSAPEVEGALEQSICEGIIDDAAEVGFQSIQFTGGDPLLCSFLPEMVERATGRGLSVEIYTNGLALSDRLLDRMAMHEPAFAFSFYSHVAEHHDRITRTPGSQRRTREAIERVSQRGLRARAAMVVTEVNRDDVADTVAYLRGLGVGHVAVTGSMEVGRGDLHTEPLGDYESNAHAGPVASDESDESYKVARGKLCVTYDGLVVPCIFNRTDVLGDISKRRLTDIVRAPQLGGDDSSAARQGLEQASRQLSCWSCRVTSCALRGLRGRRRGQ